MTRDPSPWCSLLLQAVGINYNPCVISVSPRGFDVTAAGVNIEPNVVEVLGEGLSVWPMAVNIQPALIYVNPWGANIRSAGFPPS